MSLIVGYGLWLVGFTGSHRFYYGRPITGTLWMFTGGLFLIGWIIDLFLMPSLRESAEDRFDEGEYSYNISWLLLGFLGVFGVHRLYLGKWLTGLLYLVTGGLIGFGVLYDYWTLNAQISEKNLEA